MAHAPSWQVSATTSSVRQISTFTESPGSDHETLKRTVSPDAAGSGESDTEVTEGAALLTVKVPDITLEQVFAGSHAKA
ncbi:MAG: hypothetical protein M3198_14910 [Actinomycetota bacterium]|nr:hypothetical protein [Actinomycetota bacterium]